MADAERVEIYGRSRHARGAGSPVVQSALRVLAVATWTVILGGLAGGPAAAQDMSWAKGVREDGWGDGRVTSDGDMIVFRRPAQKGPEGYPRLQLRYEYRDGMKVGPKTYLSLLALDEYDCKGGRLRNLRTGAFTRHNAEGDLLQDPAAPPQWSKPAPSTVDGTSLATACGRK